jgi:hypothetical protein
MNTPRAALLPARNPESQERQPNVAHNVRSEDSNAPPVLACIGQALHIVQDEAHDGRGNARLL